MRAQLIGLVGGGVVTALGFDQWCLRQRLQQARAAFVPAQPGAQVVVLGGGIIGVTTAFALAQRGLQVTLVERQPELAMETSHANAGTLNYVMRTLTASPENLRLALAHSWAVLTGAGRMASYNALSTTDTETAPPDVTTSPEQLGDELNALPAPPILDRLERFLASTGSGLEVGSSLEAVLREVDAQLAALGAKEAELEARVQARLSALRERLMQWSLQQEMQAMLTSFSFFSVDAALVRSVQFWKWSLNFLARCFADMNERRAFVDGLVAKSLTTLDHIAQTHPDIDFHYRQCGSIVLFFDEAQMARELQHVVPERDQVLTRAETLLLEPSLEHVQFIGAIRHTKDRVGNCREYVAGLARHAAQLGVEFRLSTNATDLRVDNGRVAAVELMDADGVADSLPCDYAVLACGPDSLAPLRSSGWSWLPILPVRGYSITGAARPELDCTPREYVLLDQPLHVIAVRFGDRIRFASHAELTTALEPDEEKLDDLERIARTFFPRAFADGADIEAWMGRRPMTSDSMPILGVGHLPNLILHTGHGADGWRWSHACAELTTALLLGETPDLPLDQLSLERFPFL